MTSVSLIWAQTRGGVIGKDGDIPWHVTEDMAFFRDITRGRPVIMGRKTWDSLPERFRPLPGRTNIVITRQSDWAADGATAATSLDGAIQQAGGAEQVFVMGGAEIYAAAMEHADTLYVTEIDADIAGDAYAPTIPEQWTADERPWTDTTSGHRVRWLTYTR